MKNSKTLTTGAEGKSCTSLASHGSGLVNSLRSMITRRGSRGTPLSAIGVVNTQRHIAATVAEGLDGTRGLQLRSMWPTRDTYDVGMVGLLLPLGGAHTRIPVCGATWSRHISARGVGRPRRCSGRVSASDGSRSAAGPANRLRGVQNLGASRGGRRDAEIGVRAEALGGDGSVWVGIEARDGRGDAVQVVEIESVALGGGGVVWLSGAGAGVGCRNRTRGDMVVSHGLCAVSRGTSRRTVAARGAGVSGAAGGAALDERDHGASVGRFTVLDLIFRLARRVHVVNLPPSCGVGRWQIISRCRAQKIEVLSGRTGGGTGRFIVDGWERFIVTGGHWELIDNVSVDQALYIIYSLTDVLWYVWMSTPATFVVTLGCDRDVEYSISSTMNRTRPHVRFFRVIGTAQRHRPGVTKSGVSVWLHWRSGCSERYDQQGPPE